MDGLKRVRLSDADWRTIRRALVDAVEWQASLSAAHKKGEDMYVVAKEREKASRALLKRITGSDRLAMEEAFDAAKNISIWDVRLTPKPPQE